MRELTNSQLQRGVDVMAMNQGKRVHLNKDMTYVLLSYDCKTSYFECRTIREMFDYLKG